MGKVTSIKENTSILFSGFCQEPPERKQGLHTCADMAVPQGCSHRAPASPRVLKGSWGRAVPKGCHHGQGCHHGLSPRAATMASAGLLERSLEQHQFLFLLLPCLPITQITCVLLPSGPGFAILIPPFWYLLDIFSITCHSSCLSPHFFIYKISPLLTLLFCYCSHKWGLAWTAWTWLALWFLGGSCSSLCLHSVCATWWPHAWHCLGLSSLSRCCPQAHSQGRSGVCL